MHQPTIAPALPALPIQTFRFGEPEQVAVSPASLYTFPEPVPGLAESHRFALIEDAAYGPLKWLQSLDEAAVCLPVLAAASVALPDYGAEVATFVHAAPDAETRVLLVTRFDEEAGSFAVNLLAPIVLDGRSGTGRQVILEDRSHPIRQHIVWDARDEVFAPC